MLFAQRAPGRAINVVPIWRTSRIVGAALRGGKGDVLLVAEPVEAPSPGLPWNAERPALGSHGPLFDSQCGQLPGCPLSPRLDQRPPPLGANASASVMAWQTASRPSW